MFSEILHFPKKLCNRIQVIMICGVFSSWTSIVFFLILKTVDNTPKTFSTTTRVLEKFLIEWAFCSTNVTITWKLFHYILMQRERSVATSYYGTLISLLGSGVSGRKLIVPLSFFLPKQIVLKMAPSLMCPCAQISIKITSLIWCCIYPCSYNI